MVYHLRGLQFSSALRENFKSYVSFPSFMRSC